MSIICNSKHLRHRLYYDDDGHWQQMVVQTVFIQHCNETWMYMEMKAIPFRIPSAKLVAYSFN